LYLRSDLDLGQFEERELQKPDRGHARPLENPMVRVGQPARQQISTRRALEASIHIGLTVLLVTACLLILRPFIPLIAWGIIIAVALYPGFRRLQHLVGGHGVPAAVLCTLVLLAIVIVPAVLLGESLVDAIQAATSKMRAELQSFRRHPATSRIGRSSAPP
jgi:predicted PurR-regulated permease PerM